MTDDPEIRLHGAPIDERHSQVDVPVAQQARQIIVRQALLDEVDGHLSEDTSIEHGGVLVGTGDATSGVVVVTGSIRAHHARGTVASLTFTHETWDYIGGVLETGFPGQRIIGWYHSHPTFGVFLSEYDLFIQQNFFSEPWQIAYVFDPVYQQRGFFGWEHGQVVRLPGWEVTSTQAGVASELPVNVPSRREFTQPALAVDLSETEAPRPTPGTVLPPPTLGGTAGPGGSTTPTAQGSTMQRVAPGGPFADRPPAASRTLALWGFAFLAVLGLVAGLFVFTRGEDAPVVDDANTTIASSTPAADATTAITAPLTESTVATAPVVSVTTAASVPATTASTAAPMVTPPPTPAETWDLVSESITCVVEACDVVPGFVVVGAASERTGSDASGVPYGLIYPNPPAPDDTVRVWELQGKGYIALDYVAADNTGKRRYLCPRNGIWSVVSLRDYEGGPPPGTTDFASFGCDEHVWKRGPVGSGLWLDVMTGATVAVDPDDAFGAVTFKGACANGKPIDFDDRPVPVVEGRSPDIHDVIVLAGAAVNEVCGQASTDESTEAADPSS